MQWKNIEKCVALNAAVGVAVDLDSRFMQNSSQLKIFTRQLHPLTAIPQCPALNVNGQAHQQRDKVVQVAI